MASKIRVYGQAQNRTALGIIHAYMKLYPKATIEDLRKAFPDELAPDKGTTEIFVESGYDDKGEHYFTKADELVETADGKKVAVVKLWTKPSYENLVRRAADYDIEVAEFEQQQHVGQKGSYELKYVNGYNPDIVALLPEAEEEETADPVVVEKKRGCMPWFWALLAILAIVLLALLLSRGCCDKTACATDDPTATETVTVVEETGTPAATADAATAINVATTAATPEVIAQLEKYQKEFDAIEYPVGEYRLKPEAKAILDRVATVLNDNPGVKMTVNGYASREGNVEANQILSDKRAATVVDYLVGKGVAADRLKAVGLCTSNPVSDQLAPNRRIDFVVE